MKTLATRCLLVTVGLGVLACACSTTSSTPAGTGGRGGGGGSNPGTGGGSPGNGGGTPGSGGAGPALGGAGPGSGGGAGHGTGGSSPTDAGAPGSGFGYTFDTSAQGFALNPYVPTPPMKNLAAPDSGASPTLVADPTDGFLTLSASFTDYRQSVDAVIGLQPAQNLSGKTLHARVRLTSGTFPVGMGATLHASSGTSYNYTGGPYTTLVAGSWTDLTLDLTMAAAPFDPTMVVQIGLQVYSGDPQEAGAFPGPVDLVIQIDSITDGAGAVTPIAIAHTFDIAAEGFAYNTYVPAASSMQTNLAAPGSGSMPTLTWDAAEGSPNPGSLKASVTFTAFRQLVDVVLNVSPPVSLMGKVLHAKVRLTSGTFENGAGATLHAGTGAAYTFGAGAYTPLTFSTWTDLTLDPATVTAAGFDPTMVVQIGVQLYSGDPTEAGTFVGPNSVVFHIDSITE